MSPQGLCRFLTLSATVTLMRVDAARAQYEVPQEGDGDVIQQSERGCVSDLDCDLDQVCQVRPKPKKRGPAAVCKRDKIDPTVSLLGMPLYVGSESGRYVGPLPPLDQLTDEVVRDEAVWVVVDGGLSDTSLIDSVWVTGEVSDNRWVEEAWFELDGMPIETLFVPGDDFASADVSSVRLEPDGPHRLKLKVRDAAGNRGSVTGRVIMDARVPTVSIVAEAPNSPSVTPVPADGLVFGTPSVRAGFRIDELNPALGTFTAANTTLVFSHPGSPLPLATIEPLTLPEGLHELSAEVKDFAGNRATAGAKIWVDLTRPVLTVKLLSNYFRHCDPEAMTGLRWEIGIDDFTQTTVEVSTGSTLGRRTKEMQEIITDLQPGLNLVMVAVTDAAGNQNTFSQPFIFELVPVDDNSVCTIDTCDPETGLVSHEDTTPIGRCCDPSTGDLTQVDDENECTIDICQVTGTVAHIDPEEASYCCDPSNGARTRIDDKVPCTTDVCDRDTGEVEHARPPKGVCCEVLTGILSTLDDGDACTRDRCDPVSGAAFHAPLQFDDENACTLDTCDPATGPVHTDTTPAGQCCAPSNGALTAVDDNNACTQDSCNPATGLVAHTDTTPAGQCCAPSTGTMSAVDDNNACTEDTCDAATGLVSHTPISVEDNNVCTTDSCDPECGVRHVNPCENGGTCTNGIDAYTCVCDMGFDGLNCEECAPGYVMDECGKCTLPQPPELTCADIPCENGVCDDSSGTPVCICTCGGTRPFCLEIATGFACEAIPTDDHYLASTVLWEPWDSIPYTPVVGAGYSQGANAATPRKVTPRHGLDALWSNPHAPSPSDQRSRWYFPETWQSEDVKDIIMSKADERVIYRDQHTGADVWLMARSPADETVPYTNDRRFNADGSLFRVGRFPDLYHEQLRCSDGALAGSPGCDFGNVPDVITWDPTNAGFFYKDYSLGRYRIAVGGDIPPAVSALHWRFPTAPLALTSGKVRELTYDLEFLVWSMNLVYGKHMYIYRSASIPPNFGTNPYKVFPFHTISASPEDDDLGTMEFMEDDDDALYLRYSLNKGNGTPEDDPDLPYQLYAIPLDDDPSGPDYCPKERYIPLTGKSEPVDRCAYPNLFLRPTSEVVVTGHGGYAPSRNYFAFNSDDADERNMTCKVINDFTGGGRRYHIDAKIPTCDHMDWTVDDDHFYVWARDNGTPLYRVSTALNAQDELKARNVLRVVATQGCRGTYHTDMYHNASPDSTKLLYASGMLSGVTCSAFDEPMLATLDLYMAISEYPKPPASLQAVLDDAGAGVHLRWSPATRNKLNSPDPESPIFSREVKGYHVYRSQTSGRDYVRIGEMSAADVTPGETPHFTWTDPAPGATPHYVVTTVEPSGLESRVMSPEASPAADADIPAADADINVYWEAEEGALTAPMRELFLPAECSGGLAIARAVRMPDWSPAVGDALAKWRVDLKRSDDYYTLWIRARSRTGAAVSAQVVTDHNVPMILDLNVASADWTWIEVTTNGTNPSFLSLDLGPRQFELVTSDSALEIDKLLLTTEAYPTIVGLGDTPWFSTQTPVSWAEDPSSSVSVRTVSGELASVMARALDRRVWVRAESSTPNGVTPECPGAAIRVFDAGVPFYICATATSFTSGPGNLDTTWMSVVGAGPNCANGGYRLQPQNGDVSYVCKGKPSPTKVITWRHPGTVSGKAAILEWQAFVDPVHHYQVYRAASSTVATTQNNLVGSPSRPHFVDPNMPAGTYHYVVQAVDAWGQVSLPSAPLTVVVP